MDLVGVKDGCGDAGHGADHAAQAQIDQHEEEHDRPQWRGREMGHGFCEGDEGQTRPLHGLRTDGQTGTNQQTDTALPVLVQSRHLPC